jgi:hypothetical protein
VLSGEESGLPKLLGTLTKMAATAVLANSETDQVALAGTQTPPLQEKILHLLSMLI